MNDTTHMPPMGNTSRLEAFTPFQLHSQLEEVRHLLNTAYFTLDGANGNTTRLESGTYAVGVVASKLDDLAFHYERLVEQHGSEIDTALNLFSLLSPERQAQALSYMRGAV